MASGYRSPLYHRHPVRRCQAERVVLSACSLNTYPLRMRFSVHLPTDRVSLGEEFVSGDMIGLDPLVGRRVRRFMCGAFV